MTPMLHRGYQGRTAARLYRTASLLIASALLIAAG